MSNFLEEIVDAVKVHIVKDDTKEKGPPRPQQPKEVKTTYHTFTLSNTLEPQLLLGHAPNRISAILQFTTAGPVVLGASRAAVVAQNSDVAQINVAAAGPITIHGTNELWGWSTVAGNTNCAVIAEYEEKH